MDALVTYGLLAGGMAVLALLNPFVGLLAYLGLLYLRPQELIPELADMNPTRTGAVILLLVVGLRLAVGSFRPPAAREIRPLLAFLGVIVVSGALECWVCSQWVVEGMVKNLVAFWLIVTLVDSERRLRLLLWTLLAFQGFMAAETLQDYLALEETELGQVRLGAFAQGYFGGAGDFAAMTTILVPFTVFFALAEPGVVRRLAALGSLALLAGGVVATEARGAGVVAMAVAFGASALMVWTRARGLRRLGPLAIGAVLAVGVALSAPTRFLERAASILHYRAEETADTRVEFWRIGLRMFRDHPVLGVGAGQYSANFRAYGGPTWMGWRASHNMFIDVVSQLGLVGMLVFGWLVLAAGGGLWRARSRLDADEPDDRFLLAVSNAGLASLATYFAAGMFQSILYYPMLYIHMAIAVATTRLIDRRRAVGEAGAEAVRIGGEREVAWSR